MVLLFFLKLRFKVAALSAHLRPQALANSITVSKRIFPATRAALLPTFPGMMH